MGAIELRTLLGVSSCGGMGAVEHPSPLGVMFHVGTDAVELPDLLNVSSGGGMGVVKVIKAKGN